MDCKPKGRVLRQPPPGTDRPSQSVRARTRGRPVGEHAPLRQVGGQPGKCSPVQSTPLHSTPFHSGAALPRGPLQASGNLSLCNNLGPNPSSPPPPPRSLADLKAGRLAPLCSGCEPGRPVAPPVEQPPGPQIGAARSTGRPAHLCTFWTNSLGRRADGRPLGPLELRARRHNGSRRRASLGPMADPKWPASRHSERWPGNED